MTGEVGIQGGVMSQLYVATNLETWEAKPPVRLDQDAICEPCGFRRLDPEYYAWLRSRMALAQKGYERGRLPSRQFEDLRNRFNAVHFWAVERFGEQALLEAVRTLDPSRYEPPMVKEPGDPSPPPPHVYPTDGDWPFTDPVAAEAVAKVDAIRDRATARSRWVGQRRNSTRTAGAAVSLAGRTTAWSPSSTAMIGWVRSPASSSRSSAHGAVDCASTASKSNSRGSVG